MSLRQTRGAGSGAKHPITIRLDHASFHFPFRRNDDLLRKSCEQRLKPLVSIDRKHPFVLPIHRGETNKPRFAP